jgi:acetyltransferase-like isoleucine patch superfamily enzyme
MINWLYIEYIAFAFEARKFLFGFENANRMLESCDKRAIIPILRKNGATVGNKCDIESPLILHNCGCSYVNFIVGDKCHIGKEVFMDLRDQVKLENSVTISMRATVITHFDVGRGPLRQADIRMGSSSVTFESGCYIGSNALVLPGVTVGACALVAAAAVVTDDVAPYHLVAGVPARTIKVLCAEDVQAGSVSAYSDH